MPAPYLPIDSYAGLPEHQWSSLVGIITAIVGNAIIAFGLNTQRYAHIRIDRELRDKQDPKAKTARKQLPKKLRQYGTLIQQEEAAEERQRINEAATVPTELNGAPEEVDGHFDNGKKHAAQEEDGEDENEGEDSQPQRKSYLRSPWWWLGIALMTVGETGNFLAYGFAPASIVSPLGVVALILNCLIAPLMLKERFRQRDFWGVVVAIGGAVTVVLSAKTNEKKLGPGGLLADIKRWEFLVYVAITVVLIIALMIASPRYGERTLSVDLGLVGLFGGYTALSTKGVASLLSTSLYRAFQYPIFYILVLVLVASAVLQIRYLNRALQNFNSTQVIPTQFVLFTLSVIIGSAVLYRDFERTDIDHVLKFVFGCLLTFGGVYLITSGREQEDEEENEEVTQHDVERIRLLDDEAAHAPEPDNKQEARNLKLDTNIHVPETPQLALSRTSSAVPSIAVTPAATSTEDINRNPFISSTDDLSRMQAQPDTGDRPQTPVHQITRSTSSQTPFFTPSTTKLQTPNQRLGRTISSPAQPQTPTRRGPSPPKPHLEAPYSVSTLKRASISLVPGPILQPLSSSLAGIVADRILRGEGTDSPVRSPLRRFRSNRESARLRHPAAGSSDVDLEAGIPNAFASENAAQRVHDARRAQVSTDSGESPTLMRTTTQEESGSFVDSIKGTKGRLRSMSETLTNFMSKARRSSKDDGRNGGGGSAIGTEGNN
ncbi:hypothetical protein LTR51_002708 [Lithohypha guttulata]|nr:hypothetical protein LTR51_002708 [Lithohypha guttulata]